MFDIALVKATDIRPLASREPLASLEKGGAEKDGAFAAILGANQSPESPANPPAGAAAGNDKATKTAEGQNDTANPDDRHPSIANGQAGLAESAMPPTGQYGEAAESLISPEKLAPDASKLQQDIGLADAKLAETSGGKAAPAETLGAKTLGAESPSEELPRPAALPTPQPTGAADMAAESDEGGLAPKLATPQTPVTTTERLPATAPFALDTAGGELAPLSPAAMRAEYARNQSAAGKSPIAADDGEDGVTRLGAAGNKTGIEEILKPAAGSAQQPAQPDIGGGLANGLGEKPAGWMPGLGTGAFAASEIALMQATPETAPTNRAAIELRHLPPPPAAAEQIALRIGKAIETGADRITIQLKPAALGRVDIRLEVAENGHTIVVVAAERAETLDLLQRDSRGLERALQNAGLDTDSQNLSFNLGNGGDAPANDADRSDGGRGDGLAFGDETGAGETDMEIAAYRLDLDGRGLIDIRV